MRVEFERRWNKLAQEVLSGMRGWRVQHPTATLHEIEEELDERMVRMRAGLLEDLAINVIMVVGGSRNKTASRALGRRLFKYSIKRFDGL